MPILSGLGDVKESEAAPPANYDLRIIAAEKGESKAGNLQYACRIKIEDPDIDAPLIFHYLTFPPDEHEYRDLMVLGIKRFLAVFDIIAEGDEFPEDDLEGASGNCFVDIVTYEGKDKNVLRLPQLKS